jgi:hypothetical protein
MNFSYLDECKSQLWMDGIWMNKIEIDARRRRASCDGDSRSSLPVFYNSMLNIQLRFMLVSLRPRRYCTNYVKLHGG